MGNQFYYTTASNEIAGPCTTLQLMALHKAGTLKDSSLVCADGSEQWVELKSIGWEMVGSHLEMETAFPNFGKDDFVNGLQPNIRPQSLTLLFKRPAR